MGASLPHPKRKGSRLSTGNWSRSALIASVVVAVDQPRPLADSGRVATAARKQAPYGCLRNGVIGTLLIRQSQQHVCIEKPVH